MKNIIFVVKDYTSGTNIMRGKMISEGLNSLGYQCKITNNLNIDVEDSILVFIGSFAERYQYYFPIKRIKELKSKGNKIVIDPVDKLTYINQYIEIESLYYQLLDGIIYPNKFSQEHFQQELNCISTVIYHQYDPRFNNFSGPKQEKFNVSYVGMMYPSPYLINPPGWLNITNVGVIKDINLQLDILSKSHIQFSHRPPQIYDFYFKPPTKMANASATNSVFVSSKDKSIVELLGENYPLYIDEDINKTTRLIKHLEEEFNRDNLDVYIKLLTPIKEKLNINTICKEYITFFKKLSI